MTIEEQIREQLVAALKTPEGQAAMRDAVLEALRLVETEKEDDLVGPAAAALRLGIAKSRVYKLAKRVELPSIKIGNSLRFKIRDLNAYRDAHRRSPELVARLASGH